MQLGEAWYPIFNEYFQTGSKWVLPAIATLPIVLVRFAQYNTFRKEREVAKEYGITPEKTKEKNWGNFDEKKTDKK